MGRKKNIKPASGENPFNMKINHQKHSVLGLRMKGVKGAPVVSHTLKNAQRRELFQRKQLKAKKSNRFLDKRLMESMLPSEERATMRMIQQRQKKMKRNIFNLNEEESLTHKGQPLTDVKAFHDSGSEDEEQLTADYVHQAHFGGFPNQEGATKSHKDVIENMIAESKQRKYERKLEHEMTSELTEKLDKDWNDVHSILSNIKVKIPTEVPMAKDAYDVALQELKFEKRAQPTNSLKSVEELAKAEEEKLQKLIQEREKRMNDLKINENIKQQNMLSADSLYDDFEIYPMTDKDFEGSLNKNYLESEESSQEDEETGETYDAMVENPEVPNEIDDFPEMVKSPEVPNEIDDFPETTPVTKEHFEALIKNLSQEEIPKVVENIVKVVLKCKSLKNLDDLESFLDILIGYILDSCMEFDKKINDLGPLLSSLYAIAECLSKRASFVFLKFLDKEYELFKESNKKKALPTIKSIILLMICESLYSASDFQHPVVTPAIIYMCDILSQSFPSSLQTITSRLFISNILLKCVSYSRRLIPESLSFLNKILKRAVFSQNCKNMQDKNLNLLYIKSPILDSIEKLDLFHMKTSINAHKISIINETIAQFHKYSALATKNICFTELFASTKNLCLNLPVENYPVLLKESISALIQVIERNTSFKRHLHHNLKPKPLELFEPRFDSKFTWRKDDIPKKRKLLKSVAQKIKKEQKGFLRDVRRDTQVVASEKLKERLVDDEDRKMKVKRIYQQLSMQEGEYKKIMKKKA